MGTEAIRCVHTFDKKYTLEHQDGSPLTPKEALLVQDEWPRKIDLPEITWKLEHDTPDIQGKLAEEFLFAQSILAWTYKTKAKVKKTAGTAFIRDRWSDKNNDDLFSSRPGTLYYAYFPGQGSMSGLMVGNDSYIWGTQPGAKPLSTGGAAKIYDLQHTKTHELGHIFGLTHETNFKDHVMWPYYNEQRLPQVNDIWRMQQKYARRVLSPWQDIAIEYRLKRGVPDRIINKS